MSTTPFFRTSHPEWSQEGTRMKALAVGIQEALNNHFVHMGGGERGREEETGRLGEKTPGVGWARPGSIDQTPAAKKVQGVAVVG